MIEISSLRRFRARLILTYFCLGIVGCEKRVENGLPMFEVDWEAWERSQSGGAERLVANPGPLMMRYTEANQRDLLLTCRESVIQAIAKATGESSDTGEVRRFPVYRYQPESKSLVLALQEDWDKATGDIVERGYDGYAKADLVVDHAQYKLLLGRRPVPTAAPLAILSRLSNSGRFAAVLSAEGPSVGLVPFFSGGGAVGQHYHQILDVTSGRFIEGVVPIPLTSDRILRACWSPKDRYIIYYTQSKLVIVPGNGTPERER